MRATRVGGVAAVLAAGIAAGWYLVVLSAAKTDPPAPPAPPNSGVKFLTRSLPADPTGLRLAGFSHLHPGMSRAEVEDVLGPPEPAALRPVGEADGRATYLMVYPLVVGSPEFVTLEFDATLAGHPLLTVRYSDPLF